MIRPTKPLRLLTVVLAVGALLAAGACGGDDVGGGSSDSGKKGSVTISGQDFTEMQILASLYQQTLQNEGYDAKLKLVSTRPIYMKELQSGSVQVVPEYLAGIGDYLNVQKNGENAKPISTHDPQATLKATEPLVKEKGITLLDPSKATDQNAYAVTEGFAKKYDLKTLSDLGKLKQPVKLAAAKDCKDRQDCAKGLKNVYGIDISEVVGLGFDSPQGKDAAKKNQVQLVQVATTDGALKDDGLVLLDDDKGLQPAQNLIPASNTKWLDKHDDARTALDKLSATLTTEDLAKMNDSVDNDRDKPSDVAKQFLDDHDLD